MSQTLIHGFKVVCVLGMEDLVSVTVCSLHAFLLNLIAIDETASSVLNGCVYLGLRFNLCLCL